MIGVEVTDALRARLDILLSDEGISEEDKAALEKGKERGYLTPRELRTAVQVNTRLGLAPIRSELGQTRLVFPDHKVVQSEPSKELLKRRAYLATRQEERSYNMMMYGKTNNPNVEEVLTMGNQFNAVQAQLSNSFNMVFTVAATCGMAYFIAKQLGLQHTQALVIALVAAILIMILEMVLYIMRATQLESHLEGDPSKRRMAEAKQHSAALLTPLDNTIRR